MTILNYELFYYRYGLRKVNQLMKPRIALVEDLKLPKASVYHFVGDGVVNGPSNDDPLFKDIKRVMQMYHVTDLDSKEGNPRLLPGQPQNWIRDYHIKHRRFRKTLDTKAGTRDIMTPFVVNYSLIDRRYRYIDNAYKLSNRWLNLETTILNTVDKLAGESEFHHFIEIELPKVLPSISLLKQASKMMNLSLLKQFDTGNALLVFEFWKWLGEERSQSLLNKIKPEHYSKINFIVRDSGAWTVFNLGVLNSWRIATKEEREANPNAPKKGFAPKRYQLLFLRYLSSFLVVRSGGADVLNNLIKQQAELDEKPTTTTVKDKVVETVDRGEKTVGDSVPSDAVALDTPPEKEPVKVATVKSELPEYQDQKAVTVSSTQNEIVDVDTPSIKDETDEVEINQETGEFILDAQTEEDLEADLAAMEKLSSLQSVKSEGSGSYTALKSNDTATPEEKIMSAANVLADEGFMTAAEYRRYETLGKRYKEIIYPGTNKTLEEMTRIDPKELVLEDAKPFKDNPTVLDKSMLKSSLSNFDKQYISEIMEKDIANVIMSLQSAGHCVTDVEKERVDEVTGSYDSYRIKIQPVEGAASTLWVKLPVLDPDEGTYLNNNVRYSYRKSRIDIPIRKVAPDKVSLTSYYGKLTAIRSNKKITDYGDWLRNHIMSKGLDNQDDTVINLRPGNAYDNTLKTPRLYSLLSFRFQSFKLGGYTWYLDYKQRSAQFNEKESKEFEVDGSLLVGKNDQGDLLLMDKKSYLYQVKYVNGVAQVNPAPSIESMLGLDKLKAPIDIVGLKVLGKIIPIGFILAYELGLENLIKSLGVNYRRIPKDGRLDLAEDEYRLVFGDESLVFSRQDEVAAMILAGMKDFHRELKKYSVYEFDRKDVYLNLLEAVGLSTRYLREIDLLFKMFVDPITKDVLEEMKEPTSFMGLLIRSVELLTTDDHPDEVDPEYMRIRGYERIPGAMYTEFVKAIRAQNSRVAKSKTPVDLNPFAVWRAITSDPAMTVANEINPIQNLKEVEAVTYSGTGGRSSRTMVKHTREYHRNDLGIMSDATVDSSDVGINVFLSSDPNFTSVRGLARRYNQEDGPGKFMSPSSLLASNIETDDKLFYCRL